MAATSYSGTHWYSSNTVYATGFVSITKGSWLVKDDVVYGFGLYPKSSQYVNDRNASSLSYSVYAKNVSTSSTPVVNGTVDYHDAGNNYYESDIYHGYSLKKARYRVTTTAGTFYSNIVSY